MKERQYKVIHVCCGIGGAALGFMDATVEYRGMVGKFVNLAGIDVDPEALADFEMLTGAPAVQLDLFSHDDYVAFHGHEPPDGWKEATPEDIRRATNYVKPDVAFISAPCQGNSGLLSEAVAQTPKYQALNNLAYRAMWLVIEAWKDDPVSVFMFENVPRITKRSSTLIKRIKAMLLANGYEVDPKKDEDGFHDCGEIASLAQHRKRYLMISKHKEKVTTFVYKPPKRKLMTIGDVIGPLPLPDDLCCGPMHRLPRLQWKTWTRLALIPAGGDWRDLEKIAPEQYKLEYVPRGGGPYGGQDWEQVGTTVIGNASIKGSNAAAVADPRVKEGTQYHNGAYRVTPWEKASPTVTGGSPATSSGKCISDPRLNHIPRAGVYHVQCFGEPSTTVTGAARVNTSNGASCIADPRLTERSGRHPGVYQVVKFDEPGPCVTGTRFGSGSPAIADPRTGFKGGTHTAIYQVCRFDESARTVTGAAGPNNGAISIADPRTGGGYSNKYQLLDWKSIASTVTGTPDIQSGAQSIADPRLCCQCRCGTMGVQSWNDPGKTVTGTGDIHSGAAAVADPRIPADTENGIWIIISTDGTWHRPLTTFEMAMLQGFPMFMPDGRPLQLTGKSDARWRKRIGNAVPPPAAKVWAEAIGRALIMSELNTWELSNQEIWVLPQEDAISDTIQVN